MNVLDVVVIALLVLSVVTGFRRGAALQIVTYTGLLLGLLGGALLAPVLARLATDPFGQSVIALTTLLVAAAVGDALGWLIGRRVWLAARRSALDPVDSAAGSVVAGIAALLVVWFLGFNLSNGPFPAMSRQIRGSAIVRALDTVLPRPPSLLAQVRGFLNRFGFPEVFADLPPIPAGPVEGPTRGQVGRAFAAGRDSTVKITGVACERIQEGSGFVIEPGYVVTNAHVVAGVGSPEVQQPHEGEAFPATTVLFDDDLDIAVLRVDGSPGPDLDLLPEPLDRGAVGAVLGYPGGGPLRGEPAAVRQPLRPLGRDIYNDDEVRRDLYELQATVRPGNSGGPFVTPDGDVAGVVFAASTADEGLGYALTAEQVAPSIEQGVGATRPVGTGPCIP